MSPVGSSSTCRLDVFGKRDIKNASRCKYDKSISQPGGEFHRREKREDRHIGELGLERRQKHRICEADEFLPESEGKRPGHGPDPSVTKKREDRRIGELGLEPMFHVEQSPQPHTRMNPFPKISLELVTRMKAWGSADFRYSRRATAWDRDRAVSTTHLGSWV